MTDSTDFLFFFLSPQQKPGEKPIPGKILILPQNIYYIKKKGYM